MDRQSHSALIVSTLQQNAKKLLENQWTELWAYYSGAGPLRVSLTHTIVPGSDGSYRLKSTLAFGLRLSYREEVELVPPNGEGPSRLPAVRNSNVAVGVDT